MVLGQVGNPGAHSGTGILAVADCEAAMVCVVVEETDAAATPAKTMERAAMRIASFMVGNPSKF